MTSKIVLKGQDIYINRIHVQRHVIEAVNFMARRCPGMASLGENLIAAYIMEKTPGLDKDEAEALFEATSLSLLGKQDIFEVSTDVLNALAGGFRRP